MYIFTLAHMLVFGHLYDRPARSNKGTKCVYIVRHTCMRMRIYMMALTRSNKGTTCVYTVRHTCTCMRMYMMILTGSNTGTK